MKFIKTTIVLLLIFLVISSCGEEKKKESDTKVESTEKAKIKVADKSSNMKNNTRRLSQLTPFTEAEFVAWRPKEMIGLPATNVNTNSPDNVAMFDVTYSANKEKIRLHIVDGAGERGSQLTAPAHMIAHQSVDEKIPMGYIKTVTEDGITAKERYAKANEEYRLEFLYGDRLYITVTTNNLGREKTWRAVEEFNFERLMVN